MTMDLSSFMFSEILNNMSIIISVLALIISVKLYFIQKGFYDLEKDLASLDKKVKKMAIEREEGEIRNNKMADLFVSYVRLDTKKERLRIKNKGKSSAKNIRFEIIEDPGIDIHTQGTFPFEQLDPEGIIELIAGTSMETGPKLKIQLIWDDDYEIDRTKEYVISLH